MRIEDWINATINLLLGVLLGLALDGLAKLATTAFWPLAVIIPLLFGSLFLVDWILDKLFNWLLPAGVRPARNPQARRRKPILRRLSLPVGLVLGVALARLGFGDTILGMLA